MILRHRDNKKILFISSYIRVISVIAAFIFHCGFLMHQVGGSSQIA